MSFAPKKIFTKKGPQKAQITTNRKLLWFAQRAWNITFVSLCFDAFLLTQSDLSRTVPGWMYQGHLIIPILWLLAIFSILQSSVRFETTQFVNRLGKRKKILLFMLLVLGATLPLFEFVIRASFGPLLGLALAIGCVGLAFYQFVRGAINVTKISSLPPRNRFLHIASEDRKNIGFFLLGIVSARASAYISALLYYYRTLPQSYFAVLEGTSLLFLLLLRPTVIRFYSACPTCKDIRSKALDGLHMCPSCSRKKFLEVA